jgi:hypothetical protein
MNFLKLGSLKHVKISPRSLIAVVALSSTMNAADPRTDLWLNTASARYARIYPSAAARLAGTAVTTWSNGTQSQSSPAYCGIQAVYSSPDWVYLRTTGLGSHTMGPWPANFPNLPANQHVLYRLPRTPTLGNPGSLTGLGVIGYFVDGVAMFDSRDGFVWNGTSEQGGAGTGYWNRDAFVNEGATFDPAYAHQENSGTYHYHANPVALRHLLGDHVDYDATSGVYRESATVPTRHSPILGWVRDGWPIYGPYAYANPTNPTSGLVRMRSGFQLRNGELGTDNIATTGRGTLPAWATRAYAVSASQPGPAVSTTYPRGRYMEDNAYLGDLGFVQGRDFDLDEYNGRWCVTPEFPGGVYAYFVAINTYGTPVFPYNIGRSYRSTPTGSAVTSVTETVSTNLLGGTNTLARLSNPAPSSNSNWVLTWTGVEGGGYRVDRSEDLNAWVTVADAITPVETTASTPVKSESAHASFRVRLISVAAHDAVDATTGGNNGGGGGGGPAGPPLTSVTPSKGQRGSTVQVVLVLGGVAPPPNLQPTSASLGTLTGSSLVRIGSQVTGTFIIPANAATGPVTASVVFPGPPGMGPVTFSLPNGFTIQ